MAGHSKWANIKRQKAVVDAKKAQVFARLSREMIVAARQGLPDPNANFQLRSAIEKAKAAGIPNENIERAIAKGAGQLGQEGSARWEAIRYEGYGPGGVAILIEALTDNRNRTAADLRAAFTKRDGNLGETGCVGWMFDQKGVITLPHPGEEEQLLDALLEAEADAYDLLDTEAETPLVEVLCQGDRLEAVVQSLKDQGYRPLQYELRWIPNNVVDVTDPDQARKLLKLMDALEDLDDIQSVTANFEMQLDLMTAAIA